MKSKLWLFQIPFVLVFTFGFLVMQMGTTGDLNQPLLRDKVFPKVRNISSFFTDWKFKLRGPVEKKNKIVVVEIDSPTIEMVGRWPWHRDFTAMLIDKTFQAGAKVVGLDMVFSEPDKRVPDELAKVLESQKLGELAKSFETDFALADVIRKYSDRLVMGWTTESTCQPGYSALEECPVLKPEAIETHPKGFEKFAAETVIGPGFDGQKTPLLSLVTFIANLDLYNGLAGHSGYFNAFLDPDSYIRRTSLMMLANQRAYPSLPLEMARAGLGEKLKVALNGQTQKLDSIEFVNSGRKLPVNELGVAEINFRGPKGSFPYVSASDLFADGDTLKDELNRKLAGVAKKDVLKDAYVLIGLTALGVFDMRAFPYESSAPGVDGHATILDNILSDDFMHRGSGTATGIILFLMVFGALGFAYATQKLESIPALLLFVGVFFGFGAIDIKVLFEHNQNWETSFLFLEYAIIFFCVLAAKYVFEEQSKKFVKGAFAKYVAPTVVDSILKDPKKLIVGGTKKNLTIMFSDIRGFTTFSERMDAKALASFLNDYLSIMTQIVFSTEGTLDKYIGDAIMAFWGAPLDQAKHAENACLAARKMMQALADNKERFRTEYGVDVNIGVGINSGAVSVGNMGSKDNFSYTVIGDSVNLSSRLEGLTKAYGVGILTTRFSFDEITQAGGTLPPHRILDDVKVKGKKKAVELIQVLDRDLPSDGLQLFEEGRQLYLKQKWDEAIAKFQEANAKLAKTGENDGPCEVYLERCRDFKVTPPAPDWDGSWEMHSK